MQDPEARSPWSPVPSWGRAQAGGRVKGRAPELRPPLGLGLPLGEAPWKEPPS